MSPSRRSHVPVAVVRTVLAAGVLLPVAPPLAGQMMQAPPPEEVEAARNAPLFAAHDVLEIELRTDIDKVRDDRSEDFEEQFGELELTRPDGSKLLMEVGVDTRGNFRRERGNCRFPPLRIDFRRKQVVGTVFEGEDEVDLVTPCDPGSDDYQDYVVNEYLIYRALNELTPVSRRVRLLRITYVDTSGEHDPLTRYAFLAEEEDRTAARNGGVIQDIPQLHPAAMEPEYATLVALFQYMIGNTDFSPVAFHNAKLFRDEYGGFYALPYDFDFSGMVSARYARPPPELPLRRVRDRLYRGFCWNADLDAAVAKFQEARPRIEALWREADFAREDTRERSLDYLDEFYEVIGDPDRVEREIVRKCREIP